MTPILLEDFSDIAPEQVEDDPPPKEDIDALKLEAFQNGYKSGWDDAVKQASQEHKNIGEELSRNLRDARLTYEETRQEILSYVEDLLKEVFSTLLPSLRPECLTSAAAVALDQLPSTEGISVSLSPDDFEPAKEILSSITENELAFSCEAALASGQARIVCLGGEAAVDVGILIEQLGQSLLGTGELDQGSNRK